MDRTDYRRQMIKTLKKLREKYGLIEYQVAHGGNATVRMARGGLRMPSSRTARKTPPLPVPAEYWDHGWSRRLSHSAKVMYLICLAEQKTSPTGLWWSLNQSRIAQKYTKAKTGFTVRSGLLELEQHDILQIGRDWPKLGEDFSTVMPNIYSLKPLLSPEEIEQEWKHLEDLHGKDKLKKARELSALLDRPNSCETTAGFLRSFAHFGIEATEQEAREVANLSRAIVSRRS